MSGTYPYVINKYRKNHNICSCFIIKSHVQFLVGLYFVHPKSIVTTSTVDSVLGDHLWEDSKVVS